MEQPLRGQEVSLDHVLHAPDVVGVGLRRDAPGLDDPRLDVVFFEAGKRDWTPNRLSE
jgi:hypothetical protein